MPRSIAVLLSCYAVLAAASRGDQSVYYRECTGQCSSACPVGQGPKVDLLNRLMLWSCEDECRYVCMRQHVELLRKEGGRQGATVHQYHGKWPFVRVLGMQEVCSVLFSLGNLWAQIRGHRQFSLALLEVQPRGGYYFAPLVFAMFVSNCNGWIWSTVFHARDFVWTERLDYFSATWLVLFSLYFAVVRVFGVARSSWRACLVPFVAYYAVHVCYLQFVKFDYSFNMAVTAGCGLAFNAIWIVSGMLRRPRERHFRKAQLVGILFTMAGLLEILDFAPIFDLVDAHSLWHLATIPITLLWYQFLAEDAIALAVTSKLQGPSKF